MLAHGNLYAVLRLQPSASASEIRSAYRHAALHAHPDKGGSTVAFHSIALAFEVLSCTASRLLYDKLLKERRVIRGAVTRTKSDRKFRNRRVSPPLCPSSKRKHADAMGSASRFNETASELKTKASLETIYALKRLQNAICDLPKPHRKLAISRMSPKLRRELLDYMVNQSTSMPCLDQPKVNQSSSRRVRGQDSFTRGTDIRALKLVHKTTYQVQLRIRHLRMYTKAQDKIDIAIQHQMCLVEARHALESSGECIWADPQEFNNVITDTLKRFGTSIEDLGLSVFISMKADDYICRPAAITSPVMGLQEAVTMHARLSKARKTSWTHLRAEWIPLMQKTQRSRVKNLSLNQVAEIVDMAHLKFLQRRLRQALSASDRSLKRRHAIEVKLAKLRRRTAKASNARTRSVFASGRHKFEKRCRWAARHHSGKRVDPTMEDTSKLFRRQV